MSTHAAEVLRMQDTAGAFARLVDRWIWVFMAALFITAVLAGFIPDSISLVQDVQAHKSPPLPWFLHIHAVAMGSWMLVLLAQTLLMATGQRRGHASLGAASLALAPLVLLLMIVMTAAFGGRALLQPPGSVPLPRYSFLLGLVFFLQGRAIVLFTVFYIWGFLARHTLPDTHKRLMLLATWSMIDAGLARIPGANELGLSLGLKQLGLDGRFDPSMVWQLAILLPALLYDLIRRGRVHYAWVVGIGAYLPFFVATHVLTKAPSWWLHILSGITGRS